ncbi:putative major facilitator superfamily transporter protein [Neofusicoccum parvum UCRNP2]|uniref:Putative major facilitator superfamily transporter protein n=1 Tax=Botryosphaeria parva (strain UCR-NP2) TaxID=1287680 RepID=R1EUV0_BOTPV|nr:putative major facilitator superfamily transporter protein [Neofusicoccum parvum UCRNP2]
MWTIGYVISQIPSQIICTRVGLAEGTFYPAVHTVLGGWYTKQELAKRACIFFASAFVGSMFSGYLATTLFQIFPAILDYPVSKINTYPTVINAITIVTTLCYGWISDGLQVRAPIVYFSLTVCFFAAMSLAIWDGVPFGLKWASFYLTGYAFNAWIPLITYNTNYAPRFLVGNSVTVGLIVCAAITLSVAVQLQRRDVERKEEVQTEPDV